MHFLLPQGRDELEAYLPTANTRDNAILQSAIVLLQSVMHFCNYCNVPDLTVTPERQVASHKTGDRSSAAIEQLAAMKQLPANVPCCTVRAGLHISTA